MSEDSESHFTITFGRAGRVVKRSGGVSDDGIAGSGSLAGTKRSVKDRLGTTAVDDSLEERSHGVFKRQRVENNQRSHRRNSSNDASLGNGDLRFKLMQKNVTSQSQNNDPPTIMDLRDKLSSKATLPPARGRRSFSPEATLCERNSMLETRDIHDGRGHNMVEYRTYGGERQSMREPRGPYSFEKQRMRDPRRTYSVERQRMREPRGRYSVERQSIPDRRDTFSAERQSMREPRGRYSVERQSIQDRRDTFSAERKSMREPRGRYSVERQSIRDRRDTFSAERQSMREPRDGYNVGRRSMREHMDINNVESQSTREPRDSYNVERRNMREPRDTYNVERRSMHHPRDSYHAVRQSFRGPREINSIERRSIQGPRGIYSAEEQSMRGPRDSYSVGRRSIQDPRDAKNFDRQRIREPRDGYTERRSMRGPRDSCNGGKSSILESRDDYDRRKNVGPGSRTGGDLPAVGHSRTPYTSDNLRRRSPRRAFGSSVSPERNVEEQHRKAQFRTYDGTSNFYRRNRVPSPQRTASSSSMSPERNVDELHKKSPIREYDDSTPNVYRRNQVPSPQSTNSSASPYRSASPLQRPSLNAASRLPANPAPVTAQFPQSSGAVLRIPNHGEQPTVDGFLQSLDLEEYSVLFRDEEVDFYALTQMNDTELQELGIPMGPRKRILHALSTYGLQRGVESRRGY